MIGSSTLQTPTQNVSPVGRLQNPGQPGTVVASHLQMLRNLEHPPANPPPYSNTPDSSSAQQYYHLMHCYSGEPAGTVLAQSMEQHRPVSLPPSYAAAVGNVRSCFDEQPEYSGLPRDGECVLEEGPIGTVQPTEINTVLSGSALEQAQKHVARIDAIIGKFDRFIGLAEDVRNTGETVTNNRADFSSARDAMVTLRNAWAGGSLKGSSLVGMTLRRTEADQRRKEGEQIVTVAIKQLLIQADADLRATPGRDMARVMTAAEDIYVMPM